MLQSRWVRWLIVLICLVLSQGLWLWPAVADPLSDRLSSFPNWSAKPPVQPARGDLRYPDWFYGDWQVTSKLIDLAAPLAPEIVTPGFAGNRRLLNQPINFKVRFIHPTSERTLQSTVIADRTFNSFSLGQATLGAKVLKTVKVDPQSPNRQITLLQGDRQLISVVSDRAIAAPAPDRFITSEFFQQEFRSPSQIYFNRVENTTAYHYLPSPQPQIEADQVTAIYLSPQDPQYFQAGDRPVALYRYQLQFLPLQSSDDL